MIFFIIIQLLQGVISQSCSNGFVSINNLCVENDISPLSSFTTYKDNLINLNLRFSFDFPTLNDTEQYIHMMIEINTPYWFAFGLGSGMTKSDMFLFEMDPVNNIITVQDGFGKNYTGPSYDLLFGGQSDIIMLGYNYFVNGTTTVKFKRLLNTNDIYDQVITQQNQQAIVAFGVDPDYKIKFHALNHGAFSFNFVEGEGKFKAPFNWFQTHWLINFIVWGVLVDFGIIIARYYKTSKWYLNAHGAIMALIVIGSLFAEIVFILQKPETYQIETFKLLTIYRQFHVVIGTVVTFQIALQLIVGVLLRLQIESKGTIFNYLWEQKQLHKYSGLLIYAMAKIQLMLGAQMSFQGKYQTVLIYAVLSFTLVYRVLFEIFYQFFVEKFALILNLNRQQKAGSFSSDANFSMNTKMLQHIAQLDFTAISQEYPGKKWAIFNNSVIDLTDHLHPGGQFIWEQIQGREVSRFIYGAYSLESMKIRPHTHSEYALKLIEKLTIGTLMNVPLFSQELSDFHTWNISHQKSITPSIKQFGLTKSGITFVTTLNGFENFGRYFLIRANSNKDISTRPYTMVLCMARCNQEFRTQMIQKALSKLEPNNQKQNQVEKRVIFQEQNDELPLIIKRYPSKNGMSQYIHSTQVGDKVQVSGPYGTSFGIQHQETGSIVIIAAGTGIFPFLDLLDFLLKKALYQLLKDSGHGAEVNPSKIDFEKYFKHDNKFILFVAVANYAELVGSDIYLTLQRIQKYLPKPNFQLIINFGDDSKVDTSCECVYKERFDHVFMQKHIPELIKVQRFLICGPPSMNRTIPLGLISLGISKQKIYLV